MMPTRRLLRHWTPVFVRPRGYALIFLYSGATPAERGGLYHNHHGNDRPHLHLFESPDRGQLHEGAVHAPEAAHDLRARHDHHHHDHHHDDRGKGPGHWHFAAPAQSAPALELLVLALCWISIAGCDEPNHPSLFAPNLQARPPPRHP
jgi:hypothetical protein